MKIKVTVTVVDKTLWAHSEKYPGCVTHAKNLTKLRQNLQEAFSLHTRKKLAIEDFILEFDCSAWLKAQPVTMTELAKIANMNRTLLNMYATQLRFCNEVTFKRINTGMKKLKVKIEYYN